MDKQCNGSAVSAHQVLSENVDTPGQLEDNVLTGKSRENARRFRILYDQPVVMECVSGYPAHVSRYWEWKKEFRNGLEVINPDVNGSITGMKSNNIGYILVSHKGTVPPPDDDMTFCWEVNADVKYYDA